MSNENATVILSSQKTGGIIAKTVIGGIIANIFISLLAIIPILGWFVISFLAVYCWIELVFATVGVARAHATLTDQGIYGANYYFGSFDVTFDQITKIKRKNKLTLIYYLDANGKKRKAKIHGIQDENSFTKACKDQFEAYKAQKAAEAAAAQAPATEA